MKKQLSLSKFFALGALFCALLVGAVMPRWAATYPSAESEPGGQTQPQKQVGSWLQKIRDWVRGRPPSQPIAFSHRQHLAVGMECLNCHQFAERGPQAGLPSLDFCMVCHQAIATESPEVQKMAAQWRTGKDVTWERVYGFEKHAHVRFEHAPHVRASVTCETCHGDMSQLTVAEVLVNHTMGSCIDCHKQKEADLDCMACHY